MTFEWVIYRINIGWKLNVKKWIWCSWRHRQDRCYPIVWEKDNKYWHCGKCHPCDQDLIDIVKAIDKGWI